MYPNGVRDITMQIALRIPAMVIRFVGTLFKKNTSASVPGNPDTVEILKGKTCFVRFQTDTGWLNLTTRNFLFQYIVCGAGN